MIRGEFEGWRLDDYTLVTADFEAPAVCEVEVVLVIDGENTPARMRWIREDSEGMAAMPNESGTWFLYLWDPWSMLSRADAPDSDI
jgi:hypothetical protein